MPAWYAIMCSKLTFGSKWPAASAGDRRLVRSVASQEARYFFLNDPRRGESGAATAMDRGAVATIGRRTILGKFGFVDEGLTHLGNGPHAPIAALAERPPVGVVITPGPLRAERGLVHTRGSRRGWISPPTPWRPRRRPGRSRNPEGACCGGNLRTVGASRPASEPRPWGRDTSPAQLGLPLARSRTPATAAAAGICSRSSSGFRTRWPRTA